MTLVDAGPDGPEPPSSEAHGRTLTRWTVLVGMVAFLLASAITGIITSRASPARTDASSGVAVPGVGEPGADESGADEPGDFLGRSSDSSGGNTSGGSAAGDDSSGGGASSTSSSTLSGGPGTSAPATQDTVGGADADRGGADGAATTGPGAQPSVPTTGRTTRTEPPSTVRTEPTAPSPPVTAAPTRAPPPVTAPPPPPTPASSGYGPCQMTWVDSTWGIDATFYQKGCIVDGVMFVATDDVNSRAIGNAARISVNMLVNRPDVWSAMASRRLRVGVIGVNQRATDLPEFRDLPTRFPAINWSGARAYSATLARPLLAAPEENLACYGNDTYPGQQVLVHEMGHTMMDLAVRYQDSGFWPQVEAAYAAALAEGRWVGYYGGSSAIEYWAEGVQAYFDASAGSPFPDGSNSPISTRGELVVYDPALYLLVESAFGPVSWRASC